MAPPWRHWVELQDAAKAAAALAEWAATHGMVALGEPYPMQHWGADGWEQQFRKRRAPR